MLSASAAVDESTISSLTSNAEDEFEGCNAAANTSVLNGQRWESKRAKVRMVEGKGKGESMMSDQHR